MKVLQLIDSLNPGGAERVAVNLANALVSYTNKSYLCTTRAEGLLKDTLSKDVGYLFLNKKSAFDRKAIAKLTRYIKTENISIIHAHSSSFFLATLLKKANNNIKIVWHDHYGNRPNWGKLNKFILKQCSKSFSHIFCVNKTLVAWAKTYLKFSNASYLANFVLATETTPKTTLLGEANKRVVCLANLRPDKDHFTLISAFKNIVKEYPDWTLHCIGKDFKDQYSKTVRKHVKTLELEQHIFFYGSVPDVSNVLKQSTIGVLSSKSEGLPMAILEYGLATLPVLVTRVGDCEIVVCNGSKGLIVEPQNPSGLAKAMALYIEDASLRSEKAQQFNSHVKAHYSFENKVEDVFNIYTKII